MWRQPARASSGSVWLWSLLRRSGGKELGSRGIPSCSSTWRRGPVGSAWGWLAGWRAPRFSWPHAREGQPGVLTWGGLGEPVPAAPLRPRLEERAASSGCLRAPVPSLSPSVL